MLRGKWLDAGCACLTDCGEKRCLRWAALHSMPLDLHPHTPAKEGLLAVDSEPLCKQNATRAD